VWEVLGSSKSVVEGYGMRAKGEKEAPNNKNEFSLEIHKRGGGGNSPWRAHHLGEITWIKDVDE
jgi:hypothetical protein